MKNAILRIIDANLNRSREGLRVCEEIARFILNSRALTAELKRIRHSVSDIGSILVSGQDMIASSRDSAEDIGRASNIRSEMRRSGVRDIFLANMERVKESLRVLEEFFKLIDKARSAKCSRLRFRVYEVEKKAVRRIDSSVAARRGLRRRG